MIVFPRFLSFSRSEAVIFGSSGILGECKNLTVLIRGLRFIPEGCQNSSMICGTIPVVCAATTGS